MSDKRIAVVYKSKYGSSEQYANWIAAEVGADLFSMSELKLNLFDEYDIFVFGGGLYADKINGIEVIKKNFFRLEEKKVFVFAVGLTDSKPEVISKLKNKNFNQTMKQNVELHILPGKFDYNQLTLWDKLMMRAFTFMLNRKNSYNLSPEEKRIKESLEKPIDQMDKKAIKSLVNKINEFKAKE